MIVCKVFDFILFNSLMIIGMGSIIFELVNLLCMKFGFKIFIDLFFVVSVLIEFDN